MIAVNEQAGETSFRKIQAYIQDAAICMITTNALEWSLKQEALHNQGMDDEGNIWFTLQEDDQHAWLYSCERMEVFYSNAHRSQFLSLVGIAGLFGQEHLPGPVYHKLAGTRRATGASRYIRFVPVEAFYWDEGVKSMMPLPLPGEAR